MAGNYADVPGDRFAYDVDGSTVVQVQSGGTINTLSQAQARTLLDESDGTSYADPSFNTVGKIAVIFPQLRTVTGMYLRESNDFVSNANQPTLEVSTNTTTGTDGTWTAATVSNPNDYAGPAIDHFRTLIKAVSGAVNIKAIRHNYSLGGGNTATHWTLHYYGSIGVSDRVALWHPTTDNPLPAAYFDWGNTPRGSTAKRPFRVKNLSSTLTASSIVLSVSALTDTAAIVAMHTLSLDDVTYAATRTISSLAPGAISSVCYLQRNLNAATALGLWSGRVGAVAGAWA